MPNPLLAPLMRWFGRLSYPKLFLLTAALFVGDVLVPDMIPFVDELLLGLGTLLLAKWKRVRPGRGETIEGEAGSRDCPHADRKSGGSGKRVSVRVDVGGRRDSKK